MAIALTAAAGFSAPPNSVDLSGQGLSVGDFCMVGITRDSGLINSNPSGWTYETYASNVSINIWYKFLESGDLSSNLAFATQDSSSAVNIRGYSGVDESTPLDTTVVNSREVFVGTSIDSDPITTVTDGAVTVLFAGLDDDAATVSSYPTGYANGVSAAGSTEQTTLASCDKTVATAGVEDPNDLTFTSTDNLASMLFALRPGAGGGGVEGAVTQTLDAATLVSTATLALSGGLTATLDDATLVSTGELAITATVTATLDDATLVATGEEPLGGVEGSVTTTLDDATLSATGVLLVSGAVSSTLDDATLVSAATLDIAGQSTATLDDVVLVSTGTLAITGAVTATLDPVTLDATGALAIVGSVATTLDDASLVSNGVSIQITVGSVTATLDDAVLSSTAEITQPEADASIPLGGGGYWDKDEEDRKKRASKEKLRDIINEAVDKLAEKPTVEVIDGEEEPTEIADVKVPEQLFSWVEREADTQGLYAVEADIQAMIEQMMLESAARLNDQRLTRLDEEEAILALLLVA